MRHSFLPEVEQKILIRGYHVRVAVVLLFLISLAGLIGIGSLFPAYISGFTEEQSQNKLVASIKKNTDADNVSRLRDELLTDAKRINSLLVATPFQPSDVIEQIVTLRGVTRITSISVNEIGSTTATLTLQGVAPTRESLVDLKNRLESVTAGHKVDLPISGLAKSKDLPFSFNIVYTLQ
ncbi:MAG: hypothetical protein RL536_43 [Candidatus Parcubacteria bacterium]|jgi:hypothetical protein